MTTHHACEQVWQYRDTPCPYCRAGSVPITWDGTRQTFATIRSRNVVIAAMRCAKLNRAQVNTSYRWTRYGRWVELD